MHIKKNVFNNAFKMVMDIKGKTKDNVRARMDLSELCKHRELELVEKGNGRMLKAKS